MDSVAILLYTKLSRNYRLPDNKEINLLKKKLSIL